MATMLLASADKKQQDAYTLREGVVIMARNGLPGR